MSYLNAPSRRVADRLPVRVAEYDVTVPGVGGETVPELYCLASTLPGHQQFPAGAIWEACPQRWPASETSIGENKTTATGTAGSAAPWTRLSWATGSTGYARSTEHSDLLSTGRTRSMSLMRWLWQHLPKGHRHQVPDRHAS